MPRYRFTPTPEQIAAVLEGLPLDPGFLWGASTAGYQVEGHFNGPADPKNNWYHVEGTPDFEPTGLACDFWRRAESDAEVCRKMGLNSFRLGVEWARCQPSTGTETLREPPPFDEAALDRYAEIMAAFRQRGMRPVVTLFHWTSPLWAGMDLLLDRHKMRTLWLEFVNVAIRGINKRLVEKHRVAPMDYFVTFNEPFSPAATTYLASFFPSAKRGFSFQRYMAAMETMLLCHCDAYDLLHRMFQEEGWAAPEVTFNPWASCIYETDLMTVDVLLAQRNGVQEPGQLNTYLARQRADFYKVIGSYPSRREGLYWRTRVESFIARAFQWAHGENFWPTLRQRLFETPGRSYLDGVAFDLYDPFLGDLFEVGLPYGLKVNQKPWEWKIRPEAAQPWLAAYKLSAGDLPLYCLENGTCYRAGHDMKPVLRQDWANRVELWRETLCEFFTGMKQGANLKGYFYWSLLDNYEWGTYEPRFGIFAVDFRNNAARRSTDIYGNNMAGAVHDVVTAWRRGDREALHKAFVASQPSCTISYE